MKSTEFKSYLYEGLLKEERRSVKLWESAGRYIAEAQLTADQITQLFQQVEQGATASGSNRTVIGKGKDVADAVATAYKDLKAKAINSKPMQNADALYDQAAEKLKQATGSDAGVMKYVDKYRTFAKKHPIAQSLIYGALIAAAGISGAGAGGAAALGLLKMTDKLLQGEKFSSAAVAGAETGALAYGASKVGDLIKGQGDTTTTTTNYQSSTTGMQPASPWDIPDSFKQKYPVDKFVYKSDGMDYYEIFDKAGNKVANFDTSNMMENFSLNTAQIGLLFEGIIVEAELWNQFKSGIGQAAGAAASKAQQVGKNITTKVTADKLQSAWQAAGSPTDSVEIGKILSKAGVDIEVVKSAMQSIGVEPTVPDVAQATDDQATQQPTVELPDISKLTVAQKQQLLAQLDALDAQPKQHTGSRQKGGLSQTPNAIRKRNARQTAKQSTVQQPSLTDLIRQRQSQGMTEDYTDLRTKLKEALAK
jgi:hypothetical protein